MSVQLSIGPVIVLGRTGKFTWRMCATVLGAQSVLVFFGALVARGLAAVDANGPATAYLLVGSGLAVLCLIAAGLMRTPIGVSVGWLIQLATFASAIIVPLMLGVGLIFTTLWVGCLVQGARLDTPPADSEQ